MTRVNYDRRRSSMTITGHAGAGVKGSDIVCAGVSALAQALIAQGKGDMAGLMPDLTMKPGEIRCRFKTDTRRGKEKARDIMETIYTGLELISREYPEHVMCTETEEDY